MGTWGTEIKDNDAFDDIYSEFFDLYNKGGQPDIISEKIIDSNQEMLEIKEERNSLWFALALAQWETKSLDSKVLSTVENIITSGDDLKIWFELNASEHDIKKRKVALDKFLEKLKSERPKAKARKKQKIKTPIFATGDCLTFKLKNNNYGGAIILATDTNPDTAYNLVATTRINQSTKPDIKDFEKSEILICNFGNWTDKTEITWRMPDLYLKNFFPLYEVIGRINVEIQYDVSNHEGKGYLFKPSYTSGWNMNYMADEQFESEKTKNKPANTLTTKQFIKKGKWWSF